MSEDTNIKDSDSTKPRARMADTLSPPEYEKKAESGHYKRNGELIPFSNDSTDSEEDSDASDIPPGQKSPKGDIVNSPNHGK